MHLQSHAASQVLHKRIAVIEDRITQQLAASIITHRLGCLYTSLTGKPVRYCYMDAFLGMYHILQCFLTKC